MNRLLSHKVSLAVLVLACAVSPALAQPSSQPSARVVGIHTVHNVYRAGQKGMLIQLDTEMDGLKAAGIMERLKAKGEKDPDQYVENQLKGQQPFAHPHYWAPFILIGDPGLAKGM
jgi:CHAT domain-containing protein